MRRTIFCYSIATLLLGTAAPGADKAEAINKDRKGLALSGYDAVAYFTSQQPTKGSEAFTHSWMGATWRFASAANRDLFAGAPERYAPQFGGYCAWAVSNNYAAPIDPAAWKITGDKLYLNYNKQVQQQWQKDLDARIAAAEKNWPGLHK